MERLNKLAYTVEKDKLIYDASHPIDAVVRVSLTPKADGKIERGQVIDHKAGTYSIHAAAGEASAIAAEEVEYTSTDTEVNVTVYISGPFRASEIKAEPELTGGDVEKLREKGIYLK